MQSDWSVACAAEDPVLVVPWSGEAGSAGYVDLAGDLSRVSGIPEALRSPDLAAALIRWNRNDSPLFTAKCDLWGYPAAEFDEEDCAGFSRAQAGYIDLIARDYAIFSEFSAAERKLRAWNEDARRIELAACRSEWILRPARILARQADEVPCDGFATTLYVWGYGESQQAAEACWSAALRALVEPVVRSR